MIEIKAMCSVKLTDGKRVKFNIDPGAPAPQIVMLNVPDDMMAQLKEGVIYTLTIEE